MAQRKEITLLYEYNDNWIGGSYYIINIIKVLNVLDDVEKPLINVQYGFGTSIEDLKKINYPYIEYFPFDNNRGSIFERVINKMGIILFGKILLKKKLNGKSIKNFYPMQLSIDNHNISNFFCWIPDFQERHLPHLFSIKEIESRKAIQETIVKKEYPVIFSSHNALNDFNEFYPHNKNRKEVLQFVSIIEDDYLQLDINQLKEKFGIKGKYFISPNQFWQHKNQTTLLKAAKILKEENQDFLIVFTGKEYDYRNPNYSINLKQFVIDNNLQNNIRFLGFIDRNEQLQLMKNSIAVVQPSLFEGWSTVVEDVKAMNHVIVLSDLPLHREQISDNTIFFSPTDENDLAVKLNYAATNNLKNGLFDNKKMQKKMAKKIISLLD
ncbi:glycosyltransferase [Flavobacterium johnsoniae]|uniref:glycosyltransferase n=1 Tax=Flavobacterium johnsoniae TaxID=986 RepID=UPI003D99034D